MHDCFAIELTGECLKCLFRLTGGVPAVAVYSRLQLRWFRPKPGARRFLRFARAASRDRRIRKP